MEVIMAAKCSCTNQKRILLKMRKLLIKRERKIKRKRERGKRKKWS